MREECAALEELQVFPSGWRVGHWQDRLERDEAREVYWGRSGRASLYTVLESLDFVLKAKKSVGGCFFFFFWRGVSFVLVV